MCLINHVSLVLLVIRPSPVRLLTLIVSLLSLQASLPSVLSEVGLLSVVSRLRLLLPIILPQEMIEGPRDFGGERFRGVVVPGAKGVIAIVGGRDEPVEPLAQELQSALRWAT